MIDRILLFETKNWFRFRASLAVDTPVLGSLSVRLSVSISEPSVQNAPSLLPSDANSPTTWSDLFCEDDINIFL